jgi:hypothetical protein
MSYRLMRRGNSNIIAISSETDINSVHCERSVVLCGALTTTFSLRSKSSAGANKLHKQTYIIWISYKVNKSGKYTPIIFY